MARAAASPRQQGEGGRAGAERGPGSPARPWSAGAAANSSRAQPPPARQAARLCGAEGYGLGARAG